ncbi:MAG: bifunctional 23S rRNA (guanine(2069)-N(7))-methyltransferase RlmK/23S rRNA (guanine(2445)-N(2))-methyltransferase RlmL, partial [Rhodanobacteraceae bacterium]
AAAILGFLAWRGHNAALWQHLHDEAEARAQEGLRNLRDCFFGSDSAPLMIEIAKNNTQSAGVAGFVRLQKRDVAYLQRPEDFEHGLLITNPPYGERMGEENEVRDLYRTLGQRLRADFSGWRTAVLVAQVQHAECDPAHAIGLRTEKRYALNNGAIACELLVAEIVPRDRIARERKSLSPGAEMVRNRIVKNLRRLKKYLARENITCFRAYDADLPEYAAAIDVYQGIALKPKQQASASRTRNASSASAPQTWLHVQEYAPPATVDANAARARLRELLRAASEALDVPPERIVLKVRRKGKGGSKYGRFDERGEKLIVVEGGLRFEVNLTDYLDTGLFLDHRIVRAKLRELAQGGRFLNLFCYTGAASVYAAAGGAIETTSVDLSATYLEWASRNMALNGCGGARHKLVQADTMTFLREDRGRYGLIYVDPPTFSNSKRAGDFDVQRDHVPLLLACAEKLQSGGAIIFSNNARRFRLDAENLGDCLAIKDFTRVSIPSDFARRPNIHGCWLLHRKAEQNSC